MENNPNLPKTTELNNPRQIAELVEQAALRFTLITIRIRGHGHPFHTLFEFKEKTDLEAIFAYKHLFIAPLDPPIGNIKIHFAPQINLRFQTEEHIVDMEVTFKGIATNRLIQLDFPRQASLSVQHRDNNRVSIQPDWPIEAMISNATDLNFIAKLHDISRGGLAFYPSDPTLAMPINSRIQVSLLAYPMPAIDLTMEILGNKPVGDKICYRGMFLFKNVKERKALDYLISRLETRTKQRRLDLFGSTFGSHPPSSQRGPETG